MGQGSTGNGRAVLRWSNQPVRVLQMNAWLRNADVQIQHVDVKSISDAAGGFPA